MTKRNFKLAPPDRITGELFGRGRDVNGNPTARYSLFWDNGLTGHDWQGDAYETRRRVQVGYSDKITGGALGLALDMFPGTRWRVKPGSVREDRNGGATFALVRDFKAEPVPVIFRQEAAGLFARRPVAVFPTLPAGKNGEFAAVFSHIGQHSAGSRDWYQTTRPATAELATRLREELEAAPYGYRLEPVKRWTGTHDLRRAGEVQAQHDRARAAAAQEKESENV